MKKILASTILASALLTGLAAHAALPHTFATLSGNTPASYIDDNFTAVNNMGITQCTATGTNTISLTPAANQGAVSGYANFQEFLFLAANTTTGAVSVTINSIGALPLYLADGVTQAGANAIQSGAMSVIAYNSALNSGGGGFQLLSQYPLSFSSTTGTGNIVLSASPTLTGTITAAAINGTAIAASSGFTGNLTGNVTGNASTVTTNANLTGDVTSVGNATTVAKIQGTTISGATGTGNVAFSASPTFTGTITGAAETLSGTLTANGQIFVASGSLFTGDGSRTIFYNTSDSTKQAQLNFGGLTTGTTRTYAFPDANGTLLLNTNNLSDVSSASTSRTNLGLAIGTNVEAWDADLDALAALSSTGFAVRTASNTWAQRTLTNSDGSVTIQFGNGVAGNPTISASPTFEQLGDVGTSALTNGDMIYYSGGLWRNSHQGSPANTMSMIISASGTAPGFKPFASSDTNVDINLLPLGSGAVRLSGHVSSAVGATSAPGTPTSCGTGSPSVTGTDVRGTITTGTAATACTLPFGTTWASAPFCVVSDNSLVGFASVTSTSTTQMVLGISAALTGGLITYHCIQ